MIPFLAGFITGAVLTVCLFVIWFGVKEDSPKRKGKQ